MGANAPFVFQHPELSKIFAQLLCVPDHFHASAHEVVNSLHMIDDALDSSDGEYESFFGKLANGIRSSWTHGRMDLSAQKIFNFIKELVVSLFLHSSHKQLSAGMRPWRKAC